MIGNQSIEIKVNDAADRRVLAGILVDAGCSVSVERRESVNANKRRATDVWMVVTREWEKSDGTVK